MSNSIRFKIGYGINWTKSRRISAHKISLKQIPAPITVIKYYMWSATPRFEPILAKALL